MSDDLDPSSGVVVTIDVSDTLEGLRGISYGQFKRFHRLDKPMREDQKQHGRLKEDSDNKAWPARRQAIRQRAGRRKGKPIRPKGRARRLLGRLAAPGSWRKLQSRYSIVFQSRASYSEAHQDGARIGNGATLPAREFLYASDRFLDFAAEWLGDGVVYSFGGKTG